jgi:hypothetical protein
MQACSFFTGTFQSRAGQDGVYRPSGDSKAYFPAAKSVQMTFSVTGAAAAHTLPYPLLEVLDMCLARAFSPHL